MIAAGDIINAENYEAGYMSELLKALTPTPMGWSNKTHYCTWKGISCDSSQAVTSIMLPSSSLTGTLPPNINSLTNLTHIDLHNNSLNGPLPYFSDLDLLQTVSLGHNNFTSYPYRCIQYLPHLRTLNLSNNLNLSNWVFPMDDLNYSEYLETIDLEATNMIGELRSEMFVSFPNLHTFIISYNQINGNLPESLGKLAVSILRLNDQGGSGFQGTINVISSMGNLSQGWLHNNSLTGQIPNMSNCTNLFDLQLHSNSLTGLIPPSLLALPSLSIISLGDNWLQGPKPEFHKGVKATFEPNYFCQSNVGPCDPQIMILLEIFEAFRSPYLFPPPISGNNACTISSMRLSNGGGLMIRCQREKIVSFEILKFNFTGTISPAFSNLTSLVNLTLAGNSLNGSIPLSLTTLPQLQVFDVSNNNLSGVIPKFSLKVKLNTTGNAFLVQNMSRQGENATTASDVQTRGSSKANLRPFWIAGVLLYS
ncbi:putative receptor protein kinase TMK1-like [Trifolium medium]|uniref:Putative receptor protein kinase TMK1-like n=1 Tax=Trifolium medium TaxID=97028 RepID=A0A392M2P0_9FABA|nr:putative receptor protein kinase TMK1-like [Trifolium medium]